MTEGQVAKENEKPPIKAVIFDFDGLLVDSELLWWEARNEILKRFGKEYPIEDKKQTMGRDYHDSVMFMINRYKIPMTFQEFKDEEYANLDRIYVPKAKLMPGALALVNQLEDQPVRRAIASSSNRERIESTLKKLGINTFDLVVAGEDVERGKPHPDIYLKAAEELGVDPKECVVLEDAPAGVESARRAGMRVVAVIDGRFTNEDDFDSAKPNLIIHSLEDFDLEKVQ